MKDSGLVLTPIQLRDVHITKIMFDAGGVIPWTAPDEIDFRINPDEPKLSSGDKELATEAEVLLRVELTSKEYKSFVADVTFCGLFTAGNPIPKDHLESFCHTNAIMLMWPYVREALADLSMKARFIPPIILPTIDVFATQASMITSVSTFEDEENKGE